MKANLFIILTFLTSSIYASANIKTPPRKGDGFENINKRKEYNFYGYKGEQIWHEFGRPYWRSNQAPAAPTAKMQAQPKMIKQVTKETRSSTLRAVSKNYNPKNKTLTLDVKFELNKSNIQTNYTSAIDRLGLALQEDKELNIEVQGHTDTTGPKSLNISLSNERAKAVKRYLINKFDISAERLSAKGYGPNLPITSNETFEGRKKNRRVDIKVIQ